MAALSERERLLRVLSGKDYDRPPVIAPGGMMSFLTSELLEVNKINGLQAVTDAEMMAQVAELTREITGLESLGVPLCLTVEAEALGATVSCGTATVEPMIIEHSLKAASEIALLAVPNPFQDARMVAVLEAIQLLKERHKNVPIIGNLSGPVTLATSIVPYQELMKLLIRDKVLAGNIIRLAAETINKFGAAMVKSGADVIVVGDPTAAGEIIGPKNFEIYILPEYQQTFSLFHDMSVRVILHICGQVGNILPFIEDTGADAFSLDSIMNIRTARYHLGSMPIMGNVSTLLLAKGKPRSIVSAVKAILAQKVAIVAPSCGLDRKTPLKNIKLMCETIKSWSSK